MKVMSSKRSKAPKNWGRMYRVGLALICLLSFTSLAYGMNWNGDFRFRFQKEKKNSDVSRDRLRIRLRFSSINKIDDSWEVGLGLASGNSDPRSTNETFDNSFETPDIRLDFAYAQWTKRDLSVWVGKYKGIKKALWLNSDLLWDSDITPEGAGFKYSKSLSGSDVFANGAVLVLDELKKESDPMLYVGQVGTGFDLGDIGIKLGIAFYDASNVKGHSLDHSSGSNEVDSLGNLVHEYRVVSPGLKVSFGKVTLFAEGASNIALEEKNKGFLVGFKFGNKSLKGFGKWQFKYNYRKLEQESWLDIFPDSDTYGGETGVQAHEAIFEFGLSKHAVFGIDFYQTKKLDSDDKQNLVQLDLVWKF